MRDDLSGKVLIVGAGPAGMAAAAALARAGHPCVTADLRARLGGMIHCQPLAGARRIPLPGSVEARWHSLSAGFAAGGARCAFWPETGFAGVDHAGRVLLGGRHAGLFAPRALILATGARELVRPRPGWTLPGVRTAGSIQIALKTTGIAPAQRIVLAGSGPLLFALGAQLALAGAPPVAIVQAGQPFRHVLDLARLPTAYLAEAASYLATLGRHRVPILGGADLLEITETEGGLSARIATRRGIRRIEAGMIGLHDGLGRNDSGLPQGAPIPVLRLGDCRETLGARAAYADGQAGGERMAAMLEGRPAPAEPRLLARERRAQAALARAFFNAADSRLADLPGETVICRCEQRTLADLRALGPAPTDREIRLTGRFGMGACQGRFCGHWVRQLAGTGAREAPLGAARLPVRPIAIADFLDHEPDQDAATPTGASRTHALHDRSSDA